MNTEEQKKQAAEAAIDHIEFGDIVGVGTGSTTNYFIDALAKIENKIDGVVASSNATKKRLRAHGITVLDLADAYPLSIYVDGTDETTKHLHLIKGGGGALTWEKILAYATEKFVCIADQSKLVDRLGKFPLPVEVIPMAKTVVAKEMIKLGGMPELRTNFITDSGNIILDVRNMDIENPIKMEKTINQIPGVVTVGLFSCRPADVLLLGTDTGIKQLDP